MRNIGLSIAAALALAFPATAKAKKKSAQAPAQVQCTDGTAAKAGRGACSHHGGVARQEEQRARNESALPSEPTRIENKGRSGDASPRRSTREGRSGQPTARCRDGSMSYAAHHSGACSHHGGVQEWLGG